MNVNDTPFGTCFPYERYAFELRQIMKHNKTNSEELSREVFDTCMHIVKKGDDLINSIKSGNNAVCAKYDMPVVQTAWQATLLRGLTHNHGFSAANGQIHEYASQNTYDLCQHENVTALQVLQQDMSAEAYDNRKQAVLMMTAMLLRDENHRIISRDLSKLALDSILHASTETACVLQQQQVLNVLNMPAKALMLQAIGLQTGKPDIGFLKDAESIGMYNTESSNELQLMLVMKGA